MIDNEFYRDLGEAWYTAEGDAVALLRQENLTKAPWVAEQLATRAGPAARVLDVGCGGGFLSLDLATRGFTVTALDVAPEVMAAGRRRDPAGRVTWRVGRAEALPFANQSFDAVCIMDVLEHVDDWARVIGEASRVLRPGGVLLAHTFNRTWRAWLFAARGLDWFLKDSQTHVHAWRMFITPRELGWAMERVGCDAAEWRGIQPRIFSRAFVRLLFTRRVPKDFGFKLGGGMGVGYLVAGLKRECRDPRAG